MCKLKFPLICGNILHLYEEYVNADYIKRMKKYLGLLNVLLAFHRQTRFHLLASS